MNENPLLDCKPYPRFDLLKPAHILPALQTVLAQNREVIAQLSQAVTAKQALSWDNFVEPLEAIDDRLEQLWAPISHLNAVQDSPALRDSVQLALPLLSDYAAQVGQNQALYAGFAALAQSAQFKTLSVAQQALIKQQLRNFKLTGVALPATKRAKYQQLSRSLAKLCNQYEQNLLDATQAWTLHITDETALAGLPDSAIAAARSLAKKTQQAGYLFNLQAPSFIPFMTYAQNRPLRQQMYTAYVTRASDQGPNAGEYDNSKVMQKIIQQRQKMAHLLGFAHYSQYSLATKMAEDVAAVEAFLLDLAARSQSAALAEERQLKAFAFALDGIDDLQAWDRSYYTEKQKMAVYGFSEEALRVYFPLPRVLSGLFKTVAKLFSIEMRAAKPPPVWHAEVQFFEIYDDRDTLRGAFYLDLYARENKNGGAWMADCTSRRVTATLTQTPVAFLNCNFNAPENGEVALLRHDEVITLFHEFGHGLHHLLTKVEVASVAGINGVPWDAVELPSQFLENWCWQAESLSFISGHVETEQPLPSALLNKMLAAKNYQAALQMLRQIEFSLFDIRLHAASGEVAIEPILKAVRAEVAVTTPPPFARFAHSFSHIFAGGYAAGYYSYKWAEVLSADAFSRFAAEGVFNPQTGQDFLQHILEKGGSEPPEKLFKQFRGREPSINPLLKHCGLY